MARMNKVFKVSESAPRSLTPYERAFLEDLVRVRTGAGSVNAEEAREMLLAQARQEAERKVQEAYAEGLRRGVEAGREQYLKSVAESAAALQAAAQSIQEARDEFLRSLEPQVVELAVAMARRILHREIGTDPECVRRTARKALEHLADCESVVIHVNPDDLEGMRVEKVKLLDEFDGLRQVTLQADASVGPGGCVVETSLMQVDARIEAQLEETLNALMHPPEPDPGEPSHDLS